MAITAVRGSLKRNSKINGYLEEVEAGKNFSLSIATVIM